jgi:hypothetical protein
MPSRTAQRRIGRRGALPAVVMGAGFSCAQIIDADFDKPFQQGGAGGDMPSASSGGAGGSTPSASSNGTGGAMSSSSSSGSSGAMSSSSSSSSSGSSGGSGGGGGADPCMLDGTCATRTIYVALESSDGKCSSYAQDVIMGDNSSIANNNFKLISQFEVFTSPSPNTVALNICTTGVGAGKTNRATLDNAAPCMTGASDLATLGYVSRTKATPAYEQLQRVTAGSNDAFVLQTALDGNSCCFKGSSCTDANTYVLAAN